MTSKLLIFLFLGMGCGAGAELPNKATCSDKDLLRQDCRLRDGVYSLRLLSESIAWFDGTWHSADVIPLKGQQSAWEKMHFALVQGRPILQLWLWDKGASVGGVQSLHWFTLELANRHFNLLAEGIVRKRRPKAEAKTEGKTENKTPEFLYDGWMTHALKPLKGGELEWSLGPEKKILPKDSNDHSAKEHGHGI